MKIVDQFLVSPPFEIDVSTSYEVTLHKVLHNNGPEGPASVNVTTDVTRPAGCTAVPGAQTPVNPIDLPVSVDIPVDEVLTIHCTEPSTHTFTFENSIALLPDGFIDPNLGNNSWHTDLTLAAVAQADAMISAQAFVSPPTEIVAGDDTAVTLRKTLHNHGPYDPVDVAITTNVTLPTLPPDCTATPDPANPTSVTLPLSVDVLVEEGWTIHCDGESITPITFTFDNSITITTPHVRDVDLSNDSASTPLTVTVLPPPEPSGRIIIDKVTDPPGSPDSFEFTLTGGPSQLNQSFSLTGAAPPHDSGPVLPGSGYNVAETFFPIGWDLTGATCDDGSPAHNIDVSPGETVTCTFTNTAQPGRIIVRKVTVEGDGSFTFETSYGPEFRLSNGQQNDSGLLAPGTYSVAETGIPAGWQLTSAVCDDGSAPGSIDLATGETVTCTFTNTSTSPPDLIVTKSASPADGSNVTTWSTITYTLTVSNVGGSTATDVVIMDRVDGGAVNHGSVTPGSGVTCTMPTSWVVRCTAASIGPGERRTVTMEVTVHASSGAVLNGAEVDPAGLIPELNEDADDPDLDCVAVGEGTDTPPQTEPDNFDCTSHPLAARLVIIKHVVNDNGGTAVASDFTMTVTGNNPSPASFPGAESPGTTVTLDAGAYSVDELGRSGYAMVFSQECTGSIAAGETKTCTVTNDDMRPTLLVTKQVINDDGGTAVASDFTMTVAGGNPSPPSFPGVGWGQIVELDPGSYSVSESGPAGYASSFSSGCSGSIAVGDAKSCTVTNDDIGAPEEITIDIKPRSYPNSINVKSRGVTPVAVLTTADFDAADLDPSTVKFATASPRRWALQDVDGDTDADLILHFRTQLTDIEAGDVQACLEGKTYQKEPVSGCDSVRTVPPESDADGDSLGAGTPRFFGDAVEASLGTDPLDGCPDDAGDDAWPADVNNDTTVDILDVVTFRQHLSSTLGETMYKDRVDLEFDGQIDVVDVLLLRPFLHESCGAVDVDTDGDGMTDFFDADDDNDAFSDVVEEHVGTNPLLACGPEAWPPDINGDARVDILDVLLYKARLTGPYDRRYDLDASNAVNILDVLLFKPKIGTRCA